MLRRKALRRIFISTLVFFIVFILYGVSKTNINTDDRKKHVKESYIYTINNDNYVSKVSIYVDKKLSLEDTIKQKLETMIKENNRNILLPSYFKPILPENTKVENIVIEDNIVKIYFSKELLNIDKDQSEKMIEALIYTVTDDNILGIEIYADGKMLKYVPKTSKKLKKVLTKNYGINKTYEVNSTNDIVKIVMNYYGKDNNKYYSIPVTKYISSNKNKLELIVSEYNKNNNLISFIDNINILSYKLNNKNLIINLDKKISSSDSEAFIKTLFDNYNINKVIIYNNNKKIIEKNKKDIEK